MKYIDYYPLVLREVYEIQIISLVFDKLLIEFESNMEQLKNELFLSTASGVGLEIWERILGLSVTDTDVEVRRFKIRSKLLGDNTSLRTKLNILLGEGNFNISVNAVECELELTITTLCSDKLAVIIDDLLDRVLPANISYKINRKIIKQGAIGTAASLNTAMTYLITNDINKQYGIESSLNSATSLNTATTVTINGKE